MQTQSGFTLVETVITIFILGIISGIFASSIYVTRAFKRADDTISVDLFLRASLDGLEHAYVNNLLLRTNGDIIGMAFNVGLQHIAVAASPPSGTQVLEMLPADTSLANGTSSLGFLTDVYSDITFTADLRVDPSTEAGWKTGLVFGYIDSDNYHRVILDSEKLVLERVQDGSVGLIDTFSTIVAPGTWFNLQITKTGTQIDVEKDAQSALSASDPFVTDGYAGIISFGETAVVTVDDLSVSSPSSFVYDFDEDVVGETPGYLFNNAPYELRDFSPTLTIEQFNDLPDLLEVTVNAAWSIEGVSKTRELKTLMFIE